jgi:NADH:ubiquinone oxidoreductase subunit 5 (subunit L)/multisubunit Na+/H+ antiporter MnhA subunit
LSVLAFALGGVALMGLPPSGAYVAKKLLLDAAAETGQWWWDFVLQAGGFFTASYVVLVLAHALRSAEAPVKPRVSIARLQEVAALALALCSLLLGLAVIGSEEALSLVSKELWSAILLVIGGALIAMGLGQKLPVASENDTVVAIMSPLRVATVAVGEMLERADGVLRRWPVAGLSMAMLVIVFVWAML